MKPEISELFPERDLWHFLKNRMDSNRESIGHGAPVDPLGCPESGVGPEWPACDSAPCEWSSADEDDGDGGPGASSAVSGAGLRVDLDFDQAGSRAHFREVKRCGKPHVVALAFVAAHRNT